MGTGQQRSKADALDVKFHFYGREVGGKMIPRDGYGVDSKTGSIVRLHPKKSSKIGPRKRGLLLVP